MKKLIKKTIIAGLAVSIVTTGALRGNAFGESVREDRGGIIVAVENQINKLIKEKKDIIEKKRLSRDSEEQRKLGIRIGEIEREISELRRNQGTSENDNKHTSIENQINKLIKEKKEIIEKKRLSRDSEEQRKLGIRIGEIEREISKLKKNNGNVNNKPQWVKDKISYYKSLGRNYCGQADINKSDIIFNSRKNNITAYKFNNNNYFKLRDLAMLSSNTDSQFNVIWSKEKNAIIIENDKNYEAVGGELENIRDGKKDVIENISKIYLNDKKVELEAYTIDGNNYFKLRDLGDLLDFNVDWDEDTKQVIIDM